MTRFLLPIITLSLMLLLLPSCNSAKSLINKGNASFEKGQYDLAGNFYKKAYSKTSYKDKTQRAEVAFKQAECYRNINYYRAEQTYRNAIRNKYNDSIVFLRIAQVQLKNGKYKEARENFQTYLAYNPTDTTGIIGLKSVELIDSLTKNPTGYIVSKVKAFNANRSSTMGAAFVGKDGNELIFTSNRKIKRKDDNKEKEKIEKQKENLVTGNFNHDLYFTKKNIEGKWSTPELIESEVNSKNDEGVPSFTSDGKTMFFTRSMTEENKGEGTLIVTSTRTNGNWSDPKTITLFNDSSISVSHPATSSNGETLYFVSDAPNGFGGKDIWRTTKIDGKWTYAENLGADINTAGNEMFPTLKNDTLYFSSDSRPGMGGLDIYKAVPYTDEKKKEHWIVTNMGVPINSNEDDFGMTFEGNSEKGFFSTSRKERGYDALWQFELPELEYILAGAIKGKDGSNLPTAKINIIGNDGENARIMTKGDGTYRFKLKKGVKYQLLASAKGYLNQRDSLNTLNVNTRESETYIHNFSLTPIDGATRIENIFYDFDKSTLRPESIKGLNELISLMIENPHITLELSSHTDYKGDNYYNRDLSARRAQAVVDYLINAGIEAARLKAVGYGEEKPSVINKAIAEKYPEFEQNTELTEEFILSLPQEQQETANQINRRTEIVITSTDYQLQQK